MRLLVACPKCKRQFDATGRPIGSRFRCHCGSPVTVRRPAGHEAAVVRCSSCGGPRNEGSPNCGYCGADFTLHEQDLDTVCPQCFARVSDRAKYCHHCGVALIPEALVSQKTPQLCPACGKQSRLGHRQIGGVPLMECDRCAGFWLSSGMFDQLVDKASQNALSADWCRPAPPRIAALCASAPRGPLYRKCPVCGKLMTRRHWARRSGVIVDICKDHGVWFDADELSRILAWVRSGNLSKAQEDAIDDIQRKERLDTAMKINALGRAPEESLYSTYPIIDATVPIIDASIPLIHLAAFASRWFR
jgi:Zn-finger nucleic acid-binding protein